MSVNQKFTDNSLANLLATAFTKSLALIRATIQELNGALLTLWHRRVTYSSVASARQNSFFLAVPLPS
jgi:chorismate mutase